MSTPNAAAAAVVSKRQRLTPKPTIGADLVAQRLTESFHEATRPTASKGISGLIKSAWRSLGSSFTANQGGSRSTSNPIPAVTPAARRSTASAASSMPPSHLPSPLKPPDFDEASPAFPRDAPTLDLHDIPRLDQIYVPLSATTRGTRRLRVLEVLQLAPGDDCIMLLPPHTKNDHRAWSEAHRAVLNQMRRIIMDPYSRQSTSRERDIAWKQHLSSREIKRDGTVAHEFHVRVCSYPERQQLQVVDLPMSEVDHLLNPATGVGITFQLIGHGRSRTCHIKMPCIPFVEFYVPIKDGESIISNINITKSTKEDKICAMLVRELNETKGDVHAWANILLSYYKGALSQKASIVKDIKTRAQTDDIGSLKELIGQEVNDDALAEFASSVDAIYKHRLDDLIGYNAVRNHLISDEDMVALYHQFKQKFPILHHTFHSIISSKHFNDDKYDEHLSTLHQKQRLIFFLALASIRAKSSHKLRYFAIIEPLALFYKGHQQPSSKTLSGAFTCTLTTALDICDNLHAELYPRFAAELESEPVQIGAHDNYQRNLACKNQYAHKSAITHKGTAYYVKKINNIEIPVGAVVTSMSGLRFKVLHSNAHGESCEFWLVSGVVFDISGVEPSAPSELVQAEHKLIREGLLLPKLGWVVEDMPGFTPRPPLVYHNQIVPPPRRAWVHRDATDAQIVFGAFESVLIDVVSFDAKCLVLCTIHLITPKTMERHKDKRYTPSKNGRR